MTFMEYGQQHSDIILLLHGGGLSWWNYRQTALLLAHRFHVVLPVLDGHADSTQPFSTIRENAARLIAHMDNHWGGQVLAIGGLSLGGQIALEMLSQRSDCCRYALIESAAVRPDPFTAMLIGPVFGMSHSLIHRKWFARLQAAYLGIPDAMFADYYRDTCKITKADMIAFLKESSLYAIGTGLSGTNASVTIAVGSREQRRTRASGKALHRAIPGSRLEILPGFRHGALSIRHPARFAEMLLEMIGR